MECCFFLFFSVVFFGILITNDLKNIHEQRDFSGEKVHALPVPFFRVYNLRLLGV